jgi:hypothetical protein
MNRLYFGEQRDVASTCHSERSLVISTEVENGVSGTSDMDGCAARVAARESGDERVKSLDDS